MPSRKELTAMSAELGQEPGSWQHDLTQQCHHEAFAIPPRRGDAILFYSQPPTGVLDDFSMHGACPILKGIKYAANIW